MKVLTIRCYIVILSRVIKITKENKHIKTHKIYIDSSNMRLHTLSTVAISYYDEEEAAYMIPWWRIICQLAYQTIFFSNLSQIMILNENALYS